MTHRADQIIDRIADILQKALGDTYKVFKNRTLAVAPDAQELPGIFIAMGADDPLNTLSTMDKIGSNLGVSIVGIMQWDETADTTDDTGTVEPTQESQLIKELLVQRRAMHIALMADYTLGLDFVAEIAYAGADAPQTDTTGDRITSGLKSRWQVPYRMNRGDPGD